MDPDLHGMVQASLASVTKERRQRTTNPVTLTTLPKATPRELRPAMDQSEIAAMIKIINPGDQVEIQFNERNAADVSYLQGMHDHGFLKVEEEDEMVMLAVSMSRSWAHPTNRIFHFKANPNWDKKWFSGRLVRRLEAIRILK